jgi:hypothetical protein
MWYDDLQGYEKRRKDQQMIAVFCDVVAVILGGTIGYFAKKLIPDGWNDIIMKGLQLASICIGMQGALEGENTLVLIISMVLGAMIGEGLGIERRFNAFAGRVEECFDRKGGKSNFAQGFLTASLMMCVGAMSIVGALNAGLKGDNTLLFTKTAIDFVGGIMFASTLGIGAIFAAGPVLLLEGGLVLLAGAVAPMLTTSVINEMTCVGSVLIIAMGLNVVADTKLKILNYMPGIFMPIILCPLLEAVMG